MMASAVKNGNDRIRKREIGIGESDISHIQFLKARKENKKTKNIKTSQEKVLLINLHWNVHTLRFHPHTQNTERPRTA